MMFLNQFDEFFEIFFFYGLRMIKNIFTFEGFVPSATLVARYLPFFSQYSNSHSFLSPDNKSFVFAGEVGGESGVWIQKIEEGVPAQRVTDGVVATWAP